tara:strand:- start:143229 stop:143693 length:465 start_codon:yes stop_codon:yes gene_type:complete
MSTKPSVKTAREVFDIWKQEDRELERQLDLIRQWMMETSAASNENRFEESASRLSQLRSYLKQHFDHENELTYQLSEIYPKPSPEIEAIQRQAARDHVQLLEKIDALIEDMNRLAPPFDSWQAAIDQVEWFVDLLEQHEEQESESICAMMPSTG